MGSDTAFSTLGSTIQGSEIDAGTITADKLTGIGGEFIVFPWEPTAVIQGTWVLTITDNYYLRQAIINSSAAAINDEITLGKFFIAAGTYEIQLFGYTRSTAGIVDLELDGSMVAQFDLYAAGTGQVVKEVTGVTIATDGLKELGIKMASKNGSSTDYKAEIAFFIFRRTA